MTAPPEVGDWTSDLRREILALGEEFAEAARILVGQALNRAMERLITTNADWFTGLDREAADAFRRAANEAMTSSARALAEKLRDPDLWLSPLTMLAPADPEPTGWGAFVPRWLGKLVTGREREMERADPLGELADPSNRVWIQMLNAADPLDPVLTEFGLRPSEIPDPGGAHFGLQPETIERLDPEGVLSPLWNRYRRLFAQYGEAQQEKEQAEKGMRAVQRWRQGDGPTKA